MPRNTIFFLVMLECSLNYNEKETYSALVLPPVQLAQLVKTAKRSAVLEERRRLAGEIHDSLGQSFSGIYMHLAVAAAAALENGNPRSSVATARMILIGALILRFIFRSLPRRRPGEGGSIRGSERETFATAIEKAERSMDTLGYI